MYKWELETVIKGIQAGYIDERERLAVLANAIAYFSNAKKPKFKKVFDRAKEERLLEQAYADGNTQNKQTVNEKRVELYNNLTAAFGERS